MKVAVKENSIADKVLEICKKARLASQILAQSSTESKNKALIKVADLLIENTSHIIAENAKDMAFAKTKPEMTDAYLDRLKLDEKRIGAMAQGLREIAELADPVGKILSNWNRPNGLDISRVSTPIGVIGVIYESRPNVTADAGALCLKSGNASILRGGSESLNSALAIISCLQKGLEFAGLPVNAIQLIPYREREAVAEMLKASDYIDVIVPRGGKGLIKRVIEESRIPLFQHLEGNNFTYVEASAKLDMAVEVVKNAKMRRTGICGATENLAIDEAILQSHLPAIVNSLIDLGCEIRGDEKVCALDSRIKPATEADWDTEYLSAIISIKSVKNSDEGLEFVKAHSSHHTDAIITEDKKLADRFLNEVDSAIVMHNASTQFADGGEFGMGAEIGIATGKLHARGPAGLEQLCTFKYIVKGNGQIRPV